MVRNKGIITIVFPCIATELIVESSDRDALKTLPALLSGYVRSGPAALVIDIKSH